jgi:N-acetylglucosaminyl-diphospho-decaprenol L-rhamnosyltransferase
MTKGETPLSVIILTWNSLRWLEPCLGSLLPQVPAGGEVIVIDNGSADGTLEELRSKYRRVRLVANRQNRGVARARNQGFLLARGEFLLLLDVDAVVGPDTLARLLQYARENPGVALVAPRLVGPDGKIQQSCRKYPTLVSKLQRVFRASADRSAPGHDEYDSFESWSEPTDVDYAIGACQLIRRRALAQVGPLDERIFYGPEDVDFCIRLRTAGWRVVTLPTVQVVHWEQRVTRWRFSRLTALHAYGLAYFFWKHRYLWSRSRVYRRLRRAAG